MFRAFIFAAAIAAAMSSWAAEPVDDRGRPVPTGVDRVVTLAPHLAELMHAAGAGHRLVGTVAYSDFPESVGSLPSVGDAFRIDLERLSALDPDVVLAWLGGNPDSAIAEIERVGIPVVALHAAGLDDIGRHLRLIGRIAGVAEEGDAAAARYDERLGALRSRHRHSQRVRVFYEISERPLITIGSRHSLHDAIELCGGENVFADLRAIAPSVSMESVIGSEPEVVVAGVYPYPPEGDALVARWNRWPRIPAVRDGHIYALDASVMGRPTPRLLDGVERMCGYIARARVSRGP